MTAAEIMAAHGLRPQSATRQQINALDRMLRAEADLHASHAAHLQAETESDTANGTRLRAEHLHAARLAKQARVHFEALRDGVTPGLRLIEGTANDA